MTTTPPPQQTVRQRNRNTLSSTITLAFWQLRLIWRLLTFTALGMIAAVVLACAIPLFSSVAMNTSLRHGLNTPVENSYMMVQSRAIQLSPQQVQSTTSLLNTYIHKNLDGYVTDPPDFSLQSQSYPFFSDDDGPASAPASSPTQAHMQLIGMNVPHVTPHVKLVQGRLPSTSQTAWEIALTPETATYLNVQPGSQIVLQTFYKKSSDESIKVPLTFRVSGTFEALNPDDVLWHGTTFESQETKLGYSLKALISNETLTLAFEKLSANYPLVSEPNLLWFYHLNTNRIEVTSIDPLLTGMNRLLIDIPADSSKPGSIEQMQVNVPRDALQEYRDRIAVTQIPVVVLNVLIVCLLLFFQSLMAELLAERQANAIAVLRSRGSSGRQIFGAFLIQSLLIGVFALLVGPLLAIPVVHLLIQRILTPGEQNGLNLIEGNPLQTAYELRWFALLVVASSVITLIFSVYRLLKLDVLALRRESARTTRKPFWQRFYLDLLLILVASVSYVFSFYLKQTGLLDAQLQVRLQAPLTLVSSICLLLGCSLLFVRLFPLLLLLGSRLSARTRTIGPTLALEQMARSPYHTLRMTLLLLFALAFVIFTLVFNASQAQHIQEVAAYQTGADFNGKIATSTTLYLPWEDQIKVYNKIHGVKTASVGYTDDLHTSDNLNTDVTLKLLAIDPTTFADATLWPTQQSLQDLKIQLHQLSNRQTELQKLMPPPPWLTKGTPTPTPQDANTTEKKPDVSIPAIVDDTTWNLFKLAPGKRFTMNGPKGSYTFIAFSHVAHIPTINDNAPGGNQERGMLVDFRSFAPIYTKNFVDQNQSFQSTLNANHVWLTSKQDTQSLNAVRQALSRGDLALSGLYDRNAIIAQGQSDPLYLTIVGVLTLGALAPVLLALLGNLIASWLNVRGRLINFALLRALGTSPRQLASILSWEQSLVYACAIGLGILFGLVLSSMTLTSLVFTSATQTGTGSDAAGTDTGVSFYALQNVPPLQIVIPTSLLIIVGVLIGISLLVLGLLISTVSRPTIGQTLRLNED